MKLTHALPIAALLAAPLVHARSAGMQGMDMHEGHETMAQQKEHRAAGAVKSVDAAKGTVTIDHEAIASINWPAMTMNFKVRDATRLAHLKPGAKVRFAFVQQGSAAVNTRID